MNNIEIIKQKILDTYGFNNLSEEQKQVINLFPEQIIKDVCSYCLEGELDNIEDIIGTLIYGYLVEYLDESKKIFEKYYKYIDLDVNLTWYNCITIMSVSEYKSITDKLFKIIKSDSLINKIQELLQTEITIDYED